MPPQRSPGPAADLFSRGASLCVSFLKCAQSHCCCFSAAWRGKFRRWRGLLKRERKQICTPHVLRLSIEVSPAAIRSLRREPRKYVPATIREGDTIYTNVELHLRGSIGSFRPVDDKPGLTIKIEKGAQRFHGLKKFHLNNSVQDPTYLSEWLCTDLFRRAGVPAPRVSHAFVELNGRKLGFYLLKESFNEDFLARYFQNTSGNLYGQPGNGDVTQPLERMQGKGEDTHSDLWALAKAAQQPPTNRSWQELQQVLDAAKMELEEKQEQMDI